MKQKPARDGVAFASDLEAVGLVAVFLAVTRSVANVHPISASRPSIVPALASATSFPGPLRPRRREVEALDEVVDRARPLGITRLGDGSTRVDPS